MHLTVALRWAAIYRAISWTFGLVFFGFVYLGFLLSIGGLPLSLGRVGEAVASPLFVAPAFAGFLLWQSVTTVAYYATVTGAVEAEMSERFDARMVKSEILEVLDERLAEMESEVRQTRSEIRNRGGSRATGSGATGTSSSDFDFEG